MPSITLGPYSTGLVQTSAGGGASAFQYRTPIPTNLTAARTDTSVTIDVPTGTQNGDQLLLLFAGGFNSTTTVPVISGWTQVSIPEQPIAQNLALYAWQRTAASEPPNYTLTLPTANGGANIVVVMLAIGGTNGIHALAQKNDGATTTTTHTSPTVTTTALCELLHIYAIDGQTTQTVDPATTELVQVIKTAFSPVELVIANERQTAPGTTAARALATDSVAHYGAERLIALEVANTSAAVRGLARGAERGVLRGVLRGVS